MEVKLHRHEISNVLAAVFGGLVIMLWLGIMLFHGIRNKQPGALGDYREAEKELHQAIKILPERLYPYYLLAKLYAEPEFYQEDKFRATADTVLTKETKVESTAVREMRTEIKKMVEKGDDD